MLIAGQLFHAGLTIQVEFTLNGYYQINEKLGQEEVLIFFDVVSI